MKRDDEQIAHVLIVVAILVLTILLCASAIGGAQRPDGVTVEAYQAQRTAAPAGVASEQSPPEQRATTLVRLRLSRLDRVLAARVAANEDSRPLRSSADGGTAGEPTTDTLAILQVVGDFAAWRSVSHARALRLLAPHVSGSRAPTRRRHAVLAALPASGRERPEGWQLELDGDWRAHARHWQRFRRGVEQLVAAGFEPPCARPVLAWGNEADAEIARSRGFVPIDCGATLNGFWGRP